MKKNVQAQKQQFFVLQLLRKNRLSQSFLSSEASSMLCAVQEHLWHWCFNDPFPQIIPLPD